VRRRGYRSGDGVSRGDRRSLRYHDRVRSISILAMCGLAGCSSGGVAEVSFVLGGGAAQTQAIPAQAHVTIQAMSPGGMMDFELDCHPPEDTDDVGFRFTLHAPQLAVSADEPARAGYYRLRDVVPAGPVTIELDAEGGPASCTVQLVPSTGACPLSVFRSVNVDHTHVATTTVPTTWEAFPVSGDHYPIWAPWSTSFPVPIRTGYLIHDLEHGGIVTSYRCGSAADSAVCTQAQADLVASRTAFGQRRTNDTPDPSQPSLYAARAWRWGLLADCYDPSELAAFMAARFRHGREDIDTDYPSPFDPTQ